eukprot:2554223-Pleurochrysis_carterae.AAC.7
MAQNRASDKLETRTTEVELRARPPFGHYGVEAATEFSHYIYIHIGQYLSTRILYPSILTSNNEVPIHLIAYDPCKAHSTTFKGVLDTQHTSIMSKHPQTGCSSCWDGFGTFANRSTRVASMLAGVILSTYMVVRGYPPPRGIEKDHGQIVLTHSGPIQIIAGYTITLCVSYTRPS